MRRLLLFIWLALSLAAASGPAFAVPSPDCPMETAPSGMASHDEMGCCKVNCAPECAAVCPGAMVPNMSVFTSPANAAKPLFAPTLATGPASAMRGAADPPPRTIIS